MGQAPNRYNPDDHEDYIECPRSRCAARNAPQSVDEFRSDCWKCGADLPRNHPASVGDEVTVDVFDMHESGEGIGRTDDGFIVMVDGLLPETRARVRITRLHDSHASGELVEKEPDDPAHEEGEEVDDVGDDDPALGSRDNFWG